MEFKCKTCHKVCQNAFDFIRHSKRKCKSTKCRDCNTVFKSRRALRTHTVLYETVQTVVKDFEGSIKNQETLERAMENLELSPIHLISWCQTRMGHFLVACQVFDDNLAAVYDVMSSVNARPEERDLLFTALNVYLLKVVSALQPTFSESYLRPNDRTNLLVSEVFAMGQKMVSEIHQVLDTPEADEFKNSLRFDDNGNMLGTLKLTGKNHDIQLSHHSKPSRQLQREEQLHHVNTKLDEVKEKVIKNLVDNIEDQNSESTWYWN